MVPFVVMVVWVMTVPVGPVAGTGPAEATGASTAATATAAARMAIEVRILGRVMVTPPVVCLAFTCTAILWHGRAANQAPCE